MPGINPQLAFRAAALLALVGWAAPVAAQGYGQQYGQQPYSPPSYGQPSYGQQPGYNQAQPAPQQGLPGLTGAWSGDKQDPTGGVMHATDYYSPDGSYVGVGQLPNGTMFRVWGQYRASPSGQGQVRVETQLQGYLPQQICAQAPGMQPRCTPFQLPQSAVAMLVFTSPNSFQATVLTMPDAGAMTMVRDPNPYLLQRQVPQQALVNIPAPPQQQPIQPQPVPTPGLRYISPFERADGTRRTGPACDDLQQRSICNINDGHLVSSGGCLVCVN